MLVATVTTHMTRVGPVSTPVDAEPGATLLLCSSVHQLATHGPNSCKGMQQPPKTLSGPHQQGLEWCWAVQAVGSTEAGEALVLPDGLGGGQRAIQLGAQKPH